MAKKIAEKVIESSSVKQVEIKHLRTMKDEAGKDVSVVLTRSLTSIDST